MRQPKEECSPRRKGFHVPETVAQQHFDPEPERSLDPQQTQSPDFLTKRITLPDGIALANGCATGEAQKIWKSRGIAERQKTTTQTKKKNTV